MKKLLKRLVVKPQNSQEKAVLSGDNLISALKTDREQFEKDFYSRKAKKSTTETSERRLGNLKIYEERSEDLEKWCENHDLPSSFLASVIAWQVVDLEFQDTNWNIYIDEAWNPRDKFLSHVADERFKYEVLMKLWLVRADFIDWRVLNYKIQIEREFLAGINWDWEIRGKTPNYEARLNEKLSVESLISRLSKTFPSQIAEIKGITEQLEDLRMELAVAELDNIQPKLEMIEQKQYLLAQIKESLKNKSYKAENISPELASEELQFKETASELKKQIKNLQTSVLNTKERVVKKIKNKQKSLHKLYNSEIEVIKSGIISLEEWKMAFELGLL